MARPTKDPAQKKGRSLSWYPTDAERTSVTAAAAKAELSVSEYQRRCIVKRGAPIIRSQISAADLALRQEAVAALSKLAELAAVRDDGIDLLTELLRIERLLSRRGGEDEAPC